MFNSKVHTFSCAFSIISFFYTGKYLNYRKWEYTIHHAKKERKSWKLSFHAEAIFLLNNYVGKLSIPSHVTQPWCEWLWTCRNPPWWSLLHCISLLIVQVGIKQAVSEIGILKKCSSFIDL